MSFIQKEGSTRSVIVCASIVIKIAKNENGRQGNLEELAIWSEWSREPNHPNTQMLCPVLWSHLSGEVIVMARADELETHDNRPVWDYVPGRHNIHDELKEENWGRYQGRIVVIDYARPR